MQNTSPPSLISVNHIVVNFKCGEPSLDQWLKTRAIKNHHSGASRCFVICNNDEVIGYYSLSAGAISREAAPKNMRRNMPENLPVLVLGRLAVDVKYHNQGLGSSLLRDAMIRSINISEEAGIFAVLIHALSNEAKQFYLSRGFIVSPIQPMTLFMTIETIKNALSGPD